MSLLNKKAAEQKDKKKKRKKNKGGADGKAGSEGDGEGDAKDNEGRLKKYGRLIHAKSVTHLEPVVDGLRKVIR